MRTAIVTGADHAYFDLMQVLLQTLRRSEIDRSYALCVLDFGLTPDEMAVVRSFGADIVRPGWWFDVPSDLRLARNLGYATRSAIPRFFPGYDMYLWLDADISVQDGDFASAFVDAARDGALAIAEEVDRSYRTEAYALKWQIGNAFRCFGLRGGLKLCLARPINSGAFALRADAPHWTTWQARYRQTVNAAGRANLDQHALMATLCLDGLPANYLNSTCNWICTRSQPLWDEDRRVFCRPQPPYEPISVLHLAGREKTGVKKITTLKGGVVSMPLTYGHSAAFEEARAVLS